MKISSLSILIPAYNDANTIKTVVTEAHRVGATVASRFEIVVIDDGSTDNTYDTLQKLKKQIKELDVHQHIQNKGYGVTIKELYMLGRYDWLFSVPGDYQIGAQELLTLLPNVKRMDCILGWRTKRNDPQARIIQSALYNGLIRMLYGIPIHDVNSVRLMKRTLVHSLSLHSQSAFVDAELIIEAKEKGYLIGEVPISHRERLGSAGGGGKWWTILPTIGEMIRFRIFH